MAEDVICQCSCSRDVVQDGKTHPLAHWPLGDFHMQVVYSVRPHGLSIDAIMCVQYNDMIDANLYIFVST